MNSWAERRSQQPVRGVGCVWALRLKENAGKPEDMRRIENLECEEPGNRNNQTNQDFQVRRKEDTEM